MNTTPDATAALPSTWSRIGRFFIVLAVFVIVGPPIGAIGLTLGTALTTSHLSIDRLSDFLVVLVTAMMMSYAFGGIPALLVGIVSALYCAWRWRLPWWVPAGAAVAAGPILTLWQVRLTQPPELLDVIAIMTALNLWASLACWWLLRRFRLA